jgi:hypothetical protein
MLVSNIAKLRSFHQTHYVEFKHTQQTFTLQSKIWSMDPRLLVELDEPRASLRIILVLSDMPQGTTVNKFYKTMKAFGVERTSLDTSRKALLKAGITAEYQPDDANIKVIDLTDFGVTVAAKLTEIAKLMEKCPHSA